MQKNDLNVFVSGASGFIGGAIARQLAQAHPDWTIIASGRSASKLSVAFPNITYLQGPLEAMRTPIRADVVVHCAGLADDRSSESELKLNNVQATANLLRCVQGCRCFVFISSSSVYDFKDGQPKSELDLPRDLSRISAYGRSKRLAEQLIEAAALPSVYILRPRAVYGPEDRVLQPRILRLLKGRCLFLPGRLAVNSSLTHIDNLIAAVSLAIGQSASGVHAYNVSDEEQYMLRQVFEAIARRNTDKAIRVIVLPMILLKGIARVGQILGAKLPFSQQSLNYLSQHAVLSTRKIQQELGFQGFRSFWD